MIRVVLADDHPIVLQGLALYLRAEAGIEVVAQTATVDDTLAAIRRTSPDIAVLDLSLPGGGVELVHRVLVDHPAVGVIVFSVYPESALALHLLKVGVRAYLSKDRSTAELVRAIRAVAAGRRYVTDTVEDLAVERTGQRADVPPHETLSTREHQVFMLLLQGKAVQDVADELDVAPSTVSNHVAKIKEKLGVGSVGEIVLYGHRVGLLG